MPYLSTPETDQLTLPSNSSYWVRMKRKATYGDQLNAQDESLKVTQGTNGSTGRPVAEVALGAYMRTLTVRLLVEWNLDDQSGQPLPIDEVSLDLLDAEDGEFLTLEAQKRIGRRQEAEQGPFVKRSGRRSTASR